jgi:phage head maturation protease
VKVKTRPTEARADLGYQPEPYEDDDEDTVTCPGCGRGNAADSSYCDQCGLSLPDAQAYSAGDDETVTCPHCSLMNDDDASYCDQCGTRLAGRDDVVVGAEPVPDEEETGRSRPQAPPRTNLLRARVGRGALEVRTNTAGEPTELYGIFSRFNEWYEIDSWWEGRFLERVLPGAFAETITNDRGAMRVLYDHGYDPMLGNKPLGPIRTLEEREEGPYYEVPLLDTDYNRDFLVPALMGRCLNGEIAGSQLGASFRFEVLEEQLVRQPKPSSFNPEAIPERSIVRAKVYEFGPVTFPANEGASAGARSLSDSFVERLVGDPRFLASFTDRVGPKVAGRILDSIPAEHRNALKRRGDQERTDRQQRLRRRARALLHTAAA